MSHYPQISIHKFQKSEVSIIQYHVEYNLQPCGWTQQYILYVHILDNQARDNLWENQYMAFWNWQWTIGLQGQGIVELPNGMPGVQHKLRKVEEGTAFQFGVIKDWGHAKNIVCTLRRKAIYSVTGIHETLVIYHNSVIFTSSSLLIVGWLVRNITSSWTC